MGSLDQIPIANPQEELAKLQAEKAKYEQNIEDEAAWGLEKDRGYMNENHAKIENVSARIREIESMLRQQPSPAPKPETPPMPATQEKKFFFNPGDRVTVKRTSGDIENDWFVIGRTPEGKILVEKNVEEVVGTIFKRTEKRKLHKSISYDNLVNWQKMSA